MRAHLTAALVVGIGLGATAPPASSSEQSAPVPFEVVTASTESVAETRVFDGTIEAIQRSTVSAETSGRVEALSVDVDDYVEAGDTIVQLRDRAQQARLDQARGALEEAKARFEEAQSEHRRIRNLFERELVSAQRMDQTKAALDSAKARLESARARVTEAQEQLEHTIVRAPYSGIVVERHVEVGETVQPGQPLMTGLSLETLRAVVDVPQGLIDEVRARGQARVRLPDGSALAAQSLTVFPYADERSHTFRVRVRLPEGRNGLYPGMLVKVVFPVGERERLLVPMGAVAYRSEVTGLYVLDESGTVRLRQVRVGPRYPDGRIEVLAGLEPGERIALDPVAAAAYLKRGRSERGGE